MIPTKYLLKAGILFPLIPWFTSYFIFPSDTQTQATNEQQNELINHKNCQSSPGDIYSNVRILKVSSGFC